MSDLFTEIMTEGQEGRGQTQTQTQRQRGTPEKEWEPETLRGAEVLQTEVQTVRRWRVAEGERSWAPIRTKLQEPERSNAETQLGDSASLLEREPVPDTAKSHTLIGHRTARCALIGAGVGHFCQGSWLIRSVVAVRCNSDVT